MNEHCMKGTGFACLCENCKAESNHNHQKHMAYLNTLKSNVVNYWTDGYSAQLSMPQVSGCERRAGGTGMSTWDTSMVAEHVLCTHPNHYPYFETNVLPGTNWEIEQYAANQFYAYRFDAESGQQAYILNENEMWNKRFSSRDEALAAIMQAEAQENIPQFFAHITENLALLQDEFELDLTTISTIEFEPHHGNAGWWIDVNKNEESGMCVWIERNKQGVLEVQLECAYADCVYPPFEEATA